jgi:hypothetical protein
MRAMRATLGGSGLAICLLLAACGNTLARPGGFSVGATGAGVTPAAHPPCTIYAAPGGRSRARGGTRTAPTSLAAGVRRLPRGGVLCVEPGVYEVHSNLTLSASGRANRPTVMTGDGGTAIIRYRGRPLDGGVVQTTFCRPWCATRNLVIENLTLDGGNSMDAGVFVREGASHVTVRSCVIFDTGASGISLNAVDHVSALHNVIWHAGYRQGWGSGITLWYGGQSHTYGGRTPWVDHIPGFHNIIAGNIVAGSYDNSPHHSDGNGIVVDGGGPTPPALIAGNLVYENTGAGISVFANGGNMWVVNNTAYADGLGFGISRAYSSEFAAVLSQNVHWVNNLAYARPSRHGQPGHTYDDKQSRIAWTRNVGFGGGSVGVAGGIANDSASLRYADPGLTSLPPVSGSQPWASAPAPWALAGALQLSPTSPIANWGITPVAAPGLTSALVRGVQAAFAR